MDLLRIKHGFDKNKRAAKVIPHFALCGRNYGCLGSREGRKKKGGGKEKGRKASKQSSKEEDESERETHTTVTPPQARRGSRADHREWRAASSKAEPPSAGS